MSFSNWGAAYSLDAKLKHQDRVVQNWPVVLLALILSFAMFSAGLPKLLGGWLDISTHAVRGHFLREFYVNERQDLLAPFFLNLNSALVWEFFDYAGVFLEVFFIFAIIRPNLFRFFVICAIFFHVFNYLMLNIAFSINIILYLLFVDWGMIISKLRKHRMLLSIERAINFRSLLIVGLLYTSFYLIYITATESVTFNVSPLRFVLEDLMNLDSLIFSGIVIFLGLIVAVLNLIHFVSKKKDFSDSTIPKYMHN
ncbi:HTTM domain-containing protein [Pontibacter diazotrophicus]